MIRRRTGFTILAGILLCGLSLHGAHSQATERHSDYDWEISLGGGYFLPAREGFREYYRGGPEVEIGGAYRVSRRMFLAFDASYNYLWKESWPRFTTLSFVPSIRMILARVPAAYIGAGLGFHRGNLFFEDDTCIPSGTNPGRCVVVSDKSYSKYGLGLEGYAGIRHFLSGRVFLELQVRYSHTFLGDPDKGEHGNVGGVSGMVKWGMVFGKY
jgi:opacity protein-like surface antigen